MNRDSESDSHHTGNEISDQNQAGSRCCHSGLERPSLQHHYPTDFSDNHLFALIVGINQYQDTNIRSLKGCINDSESFCRFLTESLYANPFHIRHLRDAEATRTGILTAFHEHLINNQEIQPNDAIIFYFAGHGSYEIPLESDNYIAGDKIETICPYDDRTGGVRGIPDRTLASLMRRLAVLKGNNITAIFDSCHSGGMGRIPDEDSRSLLPPDSPFPLGLDEAIWNMTDSIPSIMETRDPYIPYPPLESHVLLAACQHDELAYEGPLSPDGDRVGGAFTTVLLDLLRQPDRNLTKTTYVGLFHTLEQQNNKERLPKQTPYVEGNNKTRIIFSTTDLGRQLSVLLNGNGTFSVAAGTIHGVNNETEFTIISGTEHFPQRLRPSHVSALSCRFNVLDGMTLQDDSKAEITKWSQPHLKVSLQGASNGPSDSQDYDIVVSRSQSPNESVTLTRLDEIIPRYAESTISFPLPVAEARHFTLETQTSIIINPITRFNFNLLLKGDPDLIGKKLSFKLERLSPVLGGHNDGNEDIVCFPVKDGKDVFATGELLSPRPNIKKSPKVTAAVKIPDLNHFFGFTLSIRNFQTPLFPYVFGFDPATYEVAEFHHPEPTKEGPLREDRLVTIGYGTEGGDPIQFLPNEVTFFKVFVTTKYVDLRSLVQKWPFSRGTIPVRPSRFVTGEFWESWIYVVQS